MDTYLFSLLVQAAGTVLLFIVFLLLYQKFRRPAFLDWIASWGFFLASIGVLAVLQAGGGRKIAVLDDADDLSEESANCSLKTLKEPPPGSNVMECPECEKRTFKGWTCMHCGVALPRPV